MITDAGTGHQQRKTTLRYCAAKAALLYNRYIKPEADDPYFIACVCVEKKIYRIRSASLHEKAHRLPVCTMRVCICLSSIEETSYEPVHCGHTRCVLSAGSRYFTHYAGTAKGAIVLMGSDRAFIGMAATLCAG